MGHSLVESLSYSYDHGELPNSQKQAIMNLIEKKRKDKRHIDNWRPISLINVDAKIGSKVTAKEISKDVTRNPTFNQNAYVKGRTIFDAMRTIDDILEFTERYQINRVIVPTDFQKAFDSINHDFMFKALSVFNFGPSLIRWRQIFYKNISRTFMNNC